MKRLFNTMGADVKFAHTFCVGFNLVRDACVGLGREWLSGYINE